MHSCATNKEKQDRGKSKQKEPLVQTLMNIGKAGYASLLVSVAEHAQWSPLGGLQTHPDTCSTAAGAHLLGHRHRTRIVHCLGGSICRESPVPDCVVLRKRTGFNQVVMAIVAVLCSMHSCPCKSLQVSSVHHHLVMTDSEVFGGAVQTIGKCTCHTLSDIWSFYPRPDKWPNLQLIWDTSNMVYNKYIVIIVRSPKIEIMILTQHTQGSMACALFTVRIPLREAT